MINTATPTSAASTRAGPRQRSPGRVRILHVEDNPSDALLAQEYIRDVLPGVVFDTVGRIGDLTSERAADMDCAILDLSLPDATGLDALGTLRGLSDRLPIIVLTGFDDLHLAVAALRLGADDYLMKNHVDAFTLGRAIRYAVERRRLTLEVAEAAVLAAVSTATAIAMEAVAGSVTAADDSSPSPDTMPGTHEVSVRIDGDHLEYALACRSCSWQSERGSDEQHSWSQRSLEWALLNHVRFGELAHGASINLPAAEEAEAELLEAEAEADDADVDADSAPAEPPVSRRTLLSPSRWLQVGERDEGAAWPADGPEAPRA